MAASTTRNRRSPARTRQGAEVVTLDTLRRRREDRAQARAIALYEGAVMLARMEHPGLLALVAETLGENWLEERTRGAAVPKRRPTAR